MIKFDRKKKILLAANIVILSLIGFFVFKTPGPSRKVSSVESDTAAAATSLLNEINLTWEETEYGLIFKLKDNDGDLCNKWNALEIVFRAEGIAYSGEVDRVLQTSACEEGRFQQTWVPNLTQVESSEIKKTGVFGEEPPKWVMEQINLSGPAGHKNLSYQDIKAQYGSVPSLTPK